MELDDRDTIGFVGYAVEAPDHRPGRAVHVAHQRFILDRRYQVRRTAVKSPEKLRHHIEAVDVDDRIVVLNVIVVVAQQRGPVHVLHLEHAAPDRQAIPVDPPQAAARLPSMGRRVRRDSLCPFIVRK